MECIASVRIALPGYESMHGEGTTNGSLVCFKYFVHRHSFCFLLQSTHWVWIKKMLSLRAGVRLVNLLIFALVRLREMQFAPTGSLSNEKVVSVRI